MANYERFTVLAATAPQTLTASFVDLGSSTFIVENYKQLWLYLNVDINSTQNATVQVLSKATDGNWYYLPVNSAGTAKTLVDPSVFELNVDADQMQCVQVDVRGCTEVKFQVKAGTLGSPAGIILSAEAVACEWMNT
jgi:hypothetical protein